MVLSLSHGKLQVDASHIIVDHENHLLPISSEELEKIARSDTHLLLQPQLQSSFIKHKVPSSHSPHTQAHKHACTYTLQVAVTDVHLPSFFQTLKGSDLAKANQEEDNHITLCQEGTARKEFHPFNEDSATWFDDHWKSRMEDLRGAVKQAFIAGKCLCSRSFSAHSANAISVDSAMGEVVLSPGTFLYSQPGEVVLRQGPHADFRFDEGAGLIVVSFSSKAKFEYFMGPGMEGPTWLELETQTQQPDNIHVSIHNQAHIQTHTTTHTHTRPKQCSSGPRCFTTAPSTPL